MLTLPACAQTIAGPEPPASASASASARIRPCSSAATTSIAARPNPSSRSARHTVTCASSPASTRIAGAPPRPRSSTSQPARVSTLPRAAASPVTFAICAPVVSPAPDSAGSPSRSSSQPQATSSTTDAAGEETALKPFWSHAEASQSAASAAGSAPPVTNPK